MVRGLSWSPAGSTQGDRSARICESCLLNLIMFSAKWQPICSDLNALTHWGRLMHIYIYMHWYSRPSLVQIMVCSHLNQCWSIINWILVNNFQLNLTHNKSIIEHKKGFENVICKMKAMLFRSQCVKQKNGAIPHNTNYSVCNTLCRFAKRWIKQIKILPMLLP